MDRRIKFSFLVPVYNVELYLQQCLDSLVNQNFNDFEIVLIDDGSTDKSGEICEEYRKRYPDIINVIHKKNEGLLLARRTAIKKALGDYYIFIDSDDFVETRMLQEFDRIISKYDPDMIVYHLDRFDGREYSKFRDTLYSSDRLINENEKEDYYRATLLHSISNGMCGKVVRSSIVDKENDYLDFRHVSVGEDLLQSLPIITEAKRIFFTNRIMYHYRINLDSVGRVFNYGRYDSMRSVEIELEKYANVWDFDNKKNMIAHHALVETVWGTLRVLSKSEIDLNGKEVTALLKKMTDDEYMLRHYNVIDRSSLNYPQRIVFRALYGRKYALLKFVLRVLSNIRKKI